MPAYLFPSRFNKKYIIWWRFAKIDASITNQEYEENIDVTLKRLRHSYLNNSIFSYLSINSIRNKVGDLDKIVAGNIDILCIPETKLEIKLNLFPISRQFVYQYNQSIHTGYYGQQRWLDSVF